MKKAYTESNRLIWLLLLLSFAVNDSARASGINFSLGADTTLCQGDTLLLSIDPPVGDSIVYEWSTGDSASQISVTETGLYILNLTVDSCSGSDSIFVSFDSIPSINLAAEDVCFGDSALVLNDAMNVGMFRYEWNFGDGQSDTTDQRQIRHLYSENGVTYTVALSVVDLETNCRAVASTMVTSNLTPTASFVLDDVCLGDSIVIVNQSSDVAETTAEFRIDFGDGTSIVEPYRSIYKYAYANAGIFDIGVTVDNKNICLDTATISATIFSLPTVSFSGLDQSTYCFNDSEVELSGLPADGEFSGEGVTDGTGANGIFRPSLVSGRKQIEIIYSFTDSNSCTNVFSQTVEEVYPPLPLAFLLEDTSYCFQQTIDTLAVNIGGGLFDGEDFMGDASLGDSLIVFAPQDTGQYLLSYELLDSNGCTNVIDQIFTVNSLPSFTLGRDTFISAGQSITLSARINQPSDFSYQWSTGATTPTITVSDPGFYLLAVSNIRTACSQSDTILVDIRLPVHSPISSAELSYFPSLVKNSMSIYLDAGSSEAFELQVIDVLGRPWKVFQCQANERKQIDLSGLVAGNYFLIIGAKAYPFTKRN